MIQSDNIPVTGSVFVQVLDEFGNIKQELDQHNLVVTTGKDYIASRIKDATATAMSHMAVGTSGTAAAAGDTTLGAEVGRVALDSTTVSTNTVTYVATFPAGTGTGTLAEGGLFNAGAAGTMLCRTLFSSTITKGASDVVIVTWVLTIG